MLADIPLIWQALAFTACAVLLAALAAWWLFLSPLALKGRSASLPSPRLGKVVALLLGLAAALAIVGGMWDAGMHIKSGVVPGGRDFLWPPHLVVYGAFLIALAVGIGAVVVLARAGGAAASRDPRVWVRRTPALGLVVLAAFFALASIPGDALWHALFGIDLTAWSPPHLIIAAMLGVLPVSATALLLQSSGTDRTRGDDIAGLMLLSLGLNVAYIAAVLEWELLPFTLRIVETRPTWAYPVVGGVLAFIVLVLAQRLTRLRWAATITAIFFYLVRLAVTLGLGVTDNIAPSLPLWFILGAVAMDLLRALMLDRGGAGGVWLAVAYTVGFSALALPALALPALALRGDVPLTAIDNATAVALVLGATLLVEPLADWAGARLAGDR